MVLKYNTEAQRKNAIKNSKTKYMTNKTWICSACGGHDYKVAGKHMHIRTRKHLINIIII